MIPQTLHEITFVNKGTALNQKLFVNKKWRDGNGIEHDESYPIDPESSITWEYVYIDDNGLSIFERKVWETQ